jgi:hypothetical protein
MGNINSYNASGGALAITLPALAALNVGAYCIVEKNIADGTLNAITFTANTGDTLDDLSTVLVLMLPGEKKVLQVVSIAGVKYWKVTGGLHPKTGLTAITSEFSLTSSNAASTIVTYSVPVATLGAGSSFLIRLDGTVQTTSTSGTLTFTPYIQNTALAQTAVMASQTSANAASPFYLEYRLTVRTTGTSGTAIAKPYGVINLATSGVVYLTSTSTSTTTINTTSSASTPTLYVQAQWATANASNSLLVETATIERVI